MKNKYYTFICIGGLIFCFINLALKLFSGNFANIHISLSNTGLFLIASLFLLKNNETTQKDEKEQQTEQELDNLIREYEQKYENDDFL